MATSQLTAGTQLGEGREGIVYPPLGSIYNENMLFSTVSPAAP